MKTFLIILVFLTTITGCSSNNAFYQFKLTPSQQVSEDSMQSSKIKNEASVDGIVSIIYLNKVYPNKYKDYEYFYVSLYTKTNNENIKFLLNKEMALHIEELDPTNEFSELTSYSTDWKKYYIVKFKEQKEKISFVLQNEGFISDNLSFEKDE